ncbi:hypothetical protein ATANTOWER_008496, partial [Ataeniobius toweri]|nr:hypothetical protein [Ataeniobius toweri]
CTLPLTCRLLEIGTSSPMTYNGLLLTATFRTYRSVEKKSLYTWIFAICCTNFRDRISFGMPDETFGHRHGGEGYLLF